MDKKMHKVTKVKFRKNIYILYPYFCEFLLLVVAIFKLRHSILFYIKWLTQTKSGKTQQHWDASSRLQLFLMLQIGWTLVSLWNFRNIQLILTWFLTWKIHLELWKSFKFWLSWIVSRVSKINSSCLFCCLMCLLAEMRASLR